MNGKGDKPRNNFSQEFRDNYDQIDWARCQQVHFYWVLDHGRPCGCQEDVFVGTEAQAKARERLVGENSPSGMDAIKFETPDKAWAFLDEYYGRKMKRTPLHHL